MQCDYHDTGRCRSCTLLEMPYAEQLARKQAHLAQQLADVVPSAAWHEPVASVPTGFRNKAKLVIGGQVGALTAGILDTAGQGVDLRACGLYEVALSAAIPAIVAFAEDARLIPYAVPERRGEVKHIVVTAAPEGALMIRFVLRSTHHLAGLRSRLPRLLAALPTTQVVSVNIQPAHAAILEGQREIVLTECEALQLSVNGIALFLRPGSFFQTNSAVAAALYRQARWWIDASAPGSVWDLYCGVGGFALHAAAPGRRVVGVEVSGEAIASARMSLRALAPQVVDGVTFVAGDAGEAGTLVVEAPEFVVVNPPRRGLDPTVTAWIAASPATALVYSSCNPATLARDLDALADWRVREARLFDMFPQTSHHEVAVLCTR
ncbi:MAG: methyltransferase domain-containing protein [Tetrasphaera sp.]